MKLMKLFIVGATVTCGGRGSTFLVALYFRLEVYNLEKLTTAVYTRSLTIITKSCF